MATSYAVGTVRVSKDGRQKATMQSDGTWKTEPNIGGVSDVYLKAIESKRAERNIAKLDASSQNANSAYAIEPDLQRMEHLARVAPTGTGADIRATIAKTPIVGGLAGFSKKDVANLEEFRMLSSGDLLSKAAALKPLSNADLIYLEKMTAGTGQSREGNLRAVEARKWAVKKAAAYDAALQNWTRTLGAPDALNQKGVGFEQWWGSYANQKLPRPDMARPAPTPKARAATAVGSAQPSAVMSYDAKGNRIR